ncbi:MAG: hypothetical protein GY805_03990, partial [Chloroflexi bacterium]|nr:hypothetical protein [Chloroflexota bacterium]
FGLCGAYALACRFSHHAVAYDRQQVIEQLRDVNHPSERFISLHFRGEFIPEEWGEPQI